ncbi:hypothetical protein A3F64_02450 [Candidatus Saccharibacteria bacterium RIFCSPHIGHO2_12_FULL_42_8]|nr:MAG: hypothetical protein A3F64_02450 [Candidatus Saccharibacteria bacterium RIFCSPHIGHO2_12_FULL_42_8]
MKHFFKKAAIWFNHGFIVLFLFILPSAFLFTFIFSQPQNVKNMLEESGVYEILSLTIADVATNSMQGTLSSYGLSQDTIRQISNDAFSLAKVQKPSEIFIDDTYKWLNGEQSRLQLKIDLQSNQKAFLDGLSEALVKTTLAKPICTTAQLQQIASSQSQNSVLQAPCRPSNFDINSIKDIFNQQSVESQVESVQQVATSSNPDQAHTNPTSTLGIDNNIYGISIPLIFSVLKNSFYITSLLLVFAAGTLYLLIRESKKYTTNIAKPLLTTGLLLCVYAGISWWLTGQKLLSKVLPGEQGELTEKTISSFALVSIKTVFIFGGVYIFFASILFIINHRRSKKDIVVPPVPQQQVPSPVVNKK